jgi:hypothetical protein
MSLQKYFNCGVILGLLPLWFQLNNDKTLIISVKSTNNSTNVILNLSCKNKIISHKETLCLKIKTYGMGSA